MMKPIDFSKIIRYFNTRKTGKGPIRVLRDWKVLIVCFVILLCLFAAVDAYVFWKNKNLIDSGFDLAVSSDGGQLLMIDMISLDKTLDVIKSKEERFKSNLLRPTIKDPSL